MFYHFSVSLADTVKFARFLVVLGAVTVLSSCTANNMIEGIQTENSVKPENFQDHIAVQQYVDATLVQYPDASPLAPNSNSIIKVAFPRIVGIPQISASALSSAIRKSTKINAITIVDAGQKGASYQVNGSFNALDEGAGTLLVGHWQILDHTGRTLYRITEQQRTSARDTDPWLAISHQMIHSMVANSIKNMRNWIDYNS